MWSVSDETSSFSYGIDCLGVDWVGKFLFVLVILEGHVTKLVLPYPGVELAEAQAVHGIQGWKAYRIP